MALAGGVRNRGEEMKKTTTLGSMAGFALTQIAIAAGAVALPLAAQAQSRPNIEETLPPVAGKKNYAQSLVERIAARHPELLELDIHATPPGAAHSVIVGSKNPARIGRPSDADDVAVARTGTPRVEINRTGANNVEVALPLLSVTGQSVGSVEMTFPYPAGTDRLAMLRQGQHIADEMRRRIANGPEDLVTPAQYDGIPPESFAQFLVDDELEREPGVAILVLHAGVDNAAYPVVGSNIGRIGKPADASDLEVIRSGREVHARSADGRRYEVKLPLRSAAGDIVGAVAVVFPTGIASEEVMARQAQKIRDQLATRIATAQNLLGPYPQVAEQRVDKVQTAYDQPELGNQQTLPMTKAVTTGRTLEQASQEGYSEAVKNVAGVVPTNSKGTPNDAIAIRGIKLNLFSNYRLNGGLPIAGVITVPLEDKERIETLKGANALMFGVASPAGIINLVTKRAGDIDVTSVAAAGNSFGQYGGSFDIGRRVGAERELGIRVNGAAVHLENGVRDAGGYGRFGSVGFDYRLTSRLTVQGDYEYYMKHVVEQAGISLLSPVNGRIPITPVPDPRNLLSGTWNLYPPVTRNQQVRADFIVNDSWKLLAETGRSDANRSRYTVRIGGYNIVTGAGGIVNVQYAGQTYKNAFTRGEALGRFVTFGIHHDLTLGYSATERDAIGNFQFTTTMPQRQNIFDPVPLPTPVFTTPSKALPLQASYDTGLYGYDTITVTPKWRLLLGMRRTKDQETVGTRVDWSTVNSPAYGVLYDIIPSVTAFASYLEGLEAGGTAPATAVNSNEILPPAISKQKEIGIRDSHIRGLSLSGSYFEITRANAVTDPVTRIFANNGDIDYKGVEFTFVYDFLRQWTVRGAGQWLKAVQKTPDPTFNGFTPENTPRELGNLSVSYRMLWVPGLTLTGGVAGVSNRFVNNQEQGTIPGYALYNIGAGYVTRVHGKRVALQVNVDNLSNRRYWNSVQTGTYGIGMDRSVKFNARVDF